MPTPCDGPHYPTPDDCHNAVACNPSQVGFGQSPGKRCLEKVFCDCLGVCQGVVGIPAGAVAQHGVEDHEELAHGGGER
jgi:hypothetical protein